MEGDVFDELLDHSSEDKGRTIWTSVMPLANGKSEHHLVEPFETYVDGLFYLPGDIRLSEFENTLASSWSGARAQEPHDLAVTCGIGRLAEEIGRQLRVDFVIYDIGPNIGPLNRTVVLDADFLSVPLSCDLLSLRAIRTMARTLAQWIEEWQLIVSLAPAAEQMPAGRTAFIGYIPQRFRVYRNEMVSSQAAVLTRIQSAITTDFIPTLLRVGPDIVPFRTDLQLGQVQDFGKLATEAMDSGKPMFEARAGGDQLRQNAEAAFSEIASRILDRV